VTQAYHLTIFFKHKMEIVEEAKVIETFEKLKELPSNALILMAPKWY
jgi:hypothetical protein